MLLRELDMESNKMRSEIVIINENSYKVWLVSIKNQIKSAQIKTSIAVNEEMLNLYWNIGKDISEKHHF